MKPITYEELPEWEFNAGETSVDVYEATGISRSGRRVSAKGSDPYALLEECRAAANAMERGLFSRLLKLLS
jgi:hypothetical protein